jgi:two-component system NtrC family response regulator
MEIDDRLIGLLASVDWPGNIRELGNTVQQMTIHAAGDRIQVTDLPESASVFEEGGDVFLPRDGGLDLDARLAEMEKRLIEKALSHTGGVQARAAEILGIKQRSLWHRISKYGIDVSNFKM